jgi:hypothetical protein
VNLYDFVGAYIGFCCYCSLKLHTNESIERSGSAFYPMRFVHRLRGMLVQLNLPFVSAYKLHRCYLIPVCSHGYLYMSLRNVTYVHSTFAICSVSCLYSWLYFLFYWKLYAFRITYTRNARVKYTFKGFGGHLKS